MPELKPIPRFPGCFASDRGELYRTRGGSLCKVKASWNGRYYNVSLVRDDGTRKTVHVHAAVCSAFHGERPDGMVCRHVDNDPHNSRPSNLSWGTTTENNRDRVKFGTIPRGETHCRAKLRDWEVGEIRVLSGVGVRERILATAYGVSQSAIKHIRHGRSRAHVPFIIEHPPEGP